MNIEDIKTKVTESFENVESKEFLQEQIKKGVEKHRLSFQEFQNVNPDGNFDYWKHENEKVNNNSYNNTEIMAMGIFLLALDEFENEKTIIN